ncbi:MAG: hypothetical protein ACRCWF_08510 [Beijerinckiaceae bacterium]
MKITTGGIWIAGVASLLLAGCAGTTGPDGPRDLPRGSGEVVANASVNGSLFGPFSTLNENCFVRANARVRVLVQPANGTIKIRKGTGEPAFPADSPLARCNGKKVGGIIVDYTPKRGYTGPENFEFEVVFVNGERRVLSPRLTIVPTP